MQRVLDFEFPWTLRDDFVMVGDCTNKREARWNALSLGDMWIQIHKVPSLSMTDAVAMAIEGKISTVLTVDKSASWECIGRFLCIRIRFNLREPLMRGMMITFPDEGGVWVQFQYEGFPNYYFYCGKLGHVSRACTVHGLCGQQGMDRVEELRGSGGTLPYEGLEACVNLQGNEIRSQSRRSKSHSTGEGSGRIIESRRGGDMNREGMHEVVGIQIARDYVRQEGRRIKRASGGTWTILPLHRKNEINMAVRVEMKGGRE